MTSKKKQALWMAIPLLFLVIGLWQAGHWYRFITTPLHCPNATTVIVAPHTTIRQLATQLQATGLLSHPHFFVLLAHQRGYASQLRVGEYAVDSHMTPEQLLKHIAAGKTVMRKITLIEGMTMRQMRQILLSNQALQHVSVNQTDAEMMAALGHAGESPEGRFFPDTYIYTWGNKDTVILQQAYQRMEQLLAQAWPQRAPNLPYRNINDALIVASLVESEAQVPAERPLIAGVIIRRLEKNMNLQIDPTVIYGAGKPFGSPITLEDLHNDNPYNTYLHKGLPPAPINMPSAASIDAALHPATGDALYYVAQGDGSHRFSATYEQHLQAVRKYRQYQKSETGKERWYGLAIFVARSTGFY
jgi:peptidoglycan lytic transglycosylase G